VELTVIKYQAISLRSTVSSAVSTDASGVHPSTASCVL